MGVGRPVLLVRFRDPVALKPPGKVQVGPFSYDVVVDADAVARLNRGQNGFMVGATDTTRQLIAVDPDLGPDQQADTVLHEILHAVMSLTGLASDLDDDTEEQVVFRLAGPLLDVLRRNPRLVAYLTMKES